MTTTTETTDVADTVHRHLARKATQHPLFVASGRERRRNYLLRPHEAGRADIWLPFPSNYRIPWRRYKGTF